MNIIKFYKLKIGDRAREILTRNEGYVIDIRSNSIQLQLNNGKKKAFYPHEIEDITKYGKHNNKLDTC